MNGFAMGIVLFGTASCLVAGPVVSTPAESAAETISRMRVFAEPLWPVGAVPTKEENQDLLQALNAYRTKGVNEALEPILGFLKAHPASPWRPALLTNLGITYRYSGHYSKAVDAWEEAWASLKGNTSPEAQPLGDVAASGLMEMSARLGRMDRLKSLFEETKDRPFRGPSAEIAAGAHRGYSMMERHPDRSFRCGPLALASFQVATGRSTPDPRLDACSSTKEGTSLAENFHWAQDLKMGLQMAKREPGAAVIVPAVVHWKAGHFAAVVKEENGRYLVKDPTFGEERWLTREAIDDEATGYTLVGDGKLPTGWKPVAEAEAKGVWGKGNIFFPTEGDYTGDPESAPSCAVGMPQYSFLFSSASLKLVDTPVAYTPPRGPGIQFRLIYKQRTTFQPQTFTYSNVGPKWTFNWVSYITDDPTNPGQTLNLFSNIGGQVPFTGFVSGTQTFGVQGRTFEQLVRTGPSSYTKTAPDGSQEVFSVSDGATTYPRHLFLSQQIDPAGNTLTYGYDAQMRLVTLTDALGQVTTLSYTYGPDPLKVTKVTDPFGRFATLTYNAAGQLASITDAVGLTSTFTYGPNTANPGAAADFVNSMTTPYGTTTFTTSNPNVNLYTVQATDPMGGTERAELNDFLNFVLLPNAEPSAPGGVTNVNLARYLTSYWDKRAMALYPGDYTKSYNINWLLYGPDHPSSLVASSKKPLESRVWNLYQGQADTNHMGTFMAPSQVVRLLDDGSSKATSYQYNALGKIIRSTDPSGRVTGYVYDASGLDLLEVHNLTSGQDDLLAKYTYNAQHKPLTVKDAAGQTTTFTYNGFGQVTTITNPKNETTTLTYDSAGFLKQVTGPVSGSTTAFAYDAVGRVQTVTSPDGYAVTYGYDNLDRRTQVSYPDGTSEDVVYDRLDAARTKDRLGRWTVLTYNAVRQLTDVQDPQGRVTHLNWCGCGTLEGLVDPMGKITSWSRDLQGRVVGKVYPDLTSYQYAYDGVGRLAKRVDAKAQITQYSYFADGNLQQVAYSNTSKPTPTVSYTYDPRFNRLTTMTDGTGLTTYAYNPIGVAPAVGAGRLASVTGPWANSAITYSYDELGRVLIRGINGVTETRAFDTLGRTSTVTNPLGTFTYTYDGLTNRLANVAYPNGQNTAYTYFDGLGDKRLQSIRNLKSNGTNISTFNYTYDATGQIQTWSQQADVQAPKVYSFGYDAVGQLLNATLTDSGTSQLLKTYVYGYDEAGNRTTEQIDGATTTSTFNNLNQLTGQSFSATPFIAKPNGTAETATSGKGKTLKVPPVSKRLATRGTVTPSSK